MDICWECLDWYVLVLCFNWDKVEYVSIDFFFFFFLRINQTYSAGTKHYMQEKQFLQKQKQGNHTNSAEIETLCRKIISAENKIEKSHLFYRNKKHCYLLEVVHIPWWWWIVIWLLKKACHQTLHWNS